MGKAKKTKQKREAAAKEAPKLTRAEKEELTAWKAEMRTFYKESTNKKPKGKKPQHVDWNHELIW